MKKILLSLIALGAASPAHSQSLLIHGLSYHSYGHSNNYNYGLGYLFENRVIVGAYRNSENHNSMYLGYNWKYNEYLSLTVLGATGYKEFPVMFALLPTVSVPVADKFYVNLVAAPLYDTDKHRVGLLLNSSIEYRF